MQRLDNLFLKVSLRCLLIVLIMSSCNGTTIPIQRDFVHEKDDFQAIGENELSNQDDHFQHYLNKLKLEMDLNEVVNITNNKEVLVAYKPKHFQRFKLKKISKKLKTKLAEQFPDVHFYVSSDMKIFLEVEKLREKQRKSRLDNNIVAKEFEKIIDLMKEKT